MRSRFLKAFTLVEMLVALAVSSIIITATYSSYDMIATQYKKNMDIIDMHTSGRAIMRIIKRDIRMAGFEYRDNNAIITYGSISSPLTIKDSGNKCCD
ncbi:MAG TPA: prepilin-type N-terminal cleavage/methylation domain-containing protein, partial [Candidatus Thioglobus sp.]|nr:prepilin-type N-terminal cleavage/methylation domain-containing protein [Candidatus Thioglobus sp.]